MRGRRRHVSYCPCVFEMHITWRHLDSDLRVKIKKHQDTHTSSLWDVRCGDVRCGRIIGR